MCPSRCWKQIETFIFDESINIVGTRSDGLILTMQEDFSGVLSKHQIVSKVANSFKQLESYRNCQCSSEEKCQKHQTKQKGAIIENANVNKS